MKTIGLLLIALFVQSCFFRPYFKNEEREWWYFEEWDTNKDLTLDKTEFSTGFDKSRLMKKISPNARAISYAEFDSLVVKITRSSGERIENKAKGASFDVDGDQKLSEPELSSAMFVIADDNKDDKLSSLEFYEWEVYL